MVIREEKKKGRWCLYSDGQPHNTRLEYDEKLLDGVISMNLRVDADQGGVTEPIELMVVARKPKIDLEIPEEIINLYIPDIEEIINVIKSTPISANGNKESPRHIINEVIKTVRSNYTSEGLVKRYAE